MDGQKQVAQGVKMRGLGFQVNAVILVGVTIMIAALMGFIAYMSYGALVAAGEREQLQSNGRIATKLGERYYVTTAQLKHLRTSVNRELALSKEGRSRANLVKALQDSMVEEEHLFGVGITLEPNVFDGKDAELAGKDYNDATGRVSIFVGTDGAARNLVNYDKGDWYQEVKKTNVAYMTEPYQTKDGNMAVTLSLPIQINGQFAGVVMADISIKAILDELAAQSTQENFYGVFTKKRYDCCAWAKGRRCDDELLRARPSSCVYD